MVWRNTSDGFGLVTRLLHWLMAVAILFMLVFGTRLAYIQPGLANLWLYGLHKSIGLCLLALVLVRLAWHWISPPPAPLGAPDLLPQRLARWGHLLIYLLLVAIPLSGWIASSASGIDTVLFGRWTVPAIAPVSAAWEDAGWAVHGALTKLLMAVLIVHVAAAAKRQLAGDGTLRRMWSGRA